MKQKHHLFHIVHIHIWHSKIEEIFQTIPFRCALLRVNRRYCTANVPSSNAPSNGHPNGLLPLGLPAKLGQENWLILEILAEMSLNPQRMDSIIALSILVGG